jgi:hypothetical protein
MANTSLGTIAISMTLWAADLGAAHSAATQPPAEPPAAVAASETCQAGVAAPSDDSDLEVVVCAEPIR